MGHTVNPDPGLLVEGAHDPKGTEGYGGKASSLPRPKTPQHTFNPNAQIPFSPRSLSTYMTFSETPLHPFIRQTPLTKNRSGDILLEYRMSYGIRHKKHGISITERKCAVTAKYFRFFLLEGSMELYLGKYMVSRDGTIFSKTEDGLIRKKTSVTKSGYAVVYLIGGKKEYVHNIIADVFLPVVNGTRRVKHINGDRTDNRAENLLAYKYARPNT